MRSWSDLFDSHPAVIDGGLSTQLERRGHDVAGPLWTARAILENPVALEQAHHDFVLAGADVIITASYQVSRRGFVEVGRSQREADQALGAATQIARRAARSAGTRVAASVGPFGAILHDGSEYRGDYGRSHDELATFHAERLDPLIASEPDLLAIETIPDVREAAAISDALAGATDVPAWMSFTCRDAEHTCAGQPIEDAVAVAMSIPSVVAIGINCTDPQHVPGLIARMVAVSDLPVVVYPNAGGGWDAAAQAWNGAQVPVSDLAPGWAAVGVSAIGGCCGTDSLDIRRIAEAVR